MNHLAVIDRPIANSEAEAALLGAMMINNGLVDQVADRLAIEDFYEGMNQRIYAAILAEVSAGRSASPPLLRNYFIDDPDMNQLGGPGYLAKLTSSGAALVGTFDFARQIADLSQRRRLIAGLRETIAAAASHETPIATLLEQADEAITLARDSKETRGERSAAECLDAVIAGFDQPLDGVTCGNIHSVDQLLGPMRPTHLVIGAGRPGMGKTATAISYALGAASQGHGVLFISQEMGGDELGERMAADLCFEQRVPYDKIRDRRLTSEQRRDVCRARDRLAQMPLQIVDRPALTIAQLRAIIRRWVRRFAARGHKLELVIIDYLQLMRADRKMDRFEAVSEISRSLKELAKEHGIAVFALSQLSRAVEARADKRPMLSDLRESGQIEQDADAVLFFLRDEYYLRNSEPPPDTEAHEKWENLLKSCLGRIEFICAKRRNGQTGALKGDFFYHYQAVRG